MNSFEKSVIAFLGKENEENSNLENNQHIEWEASVTKFDYFSSQMETFQIKRVLTYGAI
jgi:hypothetical protein